MNSIDIELLRRSAMKIGFDIGYSSRQIALTASKPLVELEHDGQAENLSEDMFQFLTSDMKSNGATGAFDELGLFKEFGYGEGEANTSNLVFDRLGEYRNKWFEYQKLSWDSKPIKRSTFAKIPGDQKARPPHDLFKYRIQA